MHLQLRDSPADAAPDAVAEGNRAEGVDAVRGVFPYPAVRLKVGGVEEVLLIPGCGVVAQSQLGLKDTAGLLFINSFRSEQKAGSRYIWFYWTVFV